MGENGPTLVENNPRTSARNHIIWGSLRFPCQKCRYFLSVIVAADIAFPKLVKHLLFAVSRGVLWRTSGGRT
jgi:hypothetical protein